MKIPMVVRYCAKGNINWGLDILVDGAKGTTINNHRQKPESCNIFRRKFDVR